MTVSTLVGDPDLANGEGADPTESPDTFCTDPETECRTMLCPKFNTFAGPMGQCTAHLGGENESDCD